MPQSRLPVTFIPSYFEDCPSSVTLNDLSTCPLTSSITASDELVMHASSMWMVMNHVVDPDPLTDRHGSESVVVSPMSRRAFVEVGRHNDGAYLVW